MKLELLKLDEYPQIEQIYKDNGGTVNSDTLVIAVMREGDKIVGMCALEQLLHLGPLWVDPQWRGKGIAGLLINKIEEYMTKAMGSGYYTFPSNENSCHVFDKLGLEKMPWSVYKREF